jgi:hypothetical protein
MPYIVLDLWLRRDTFVENSSKPKIQHYVRHIGCPAQNWTEEMIKLGSNRCGGYQAFKESLMGSS